MATVCRPLLAAAKPFWETKDPAGWSGEEKQILLSESPWAREGFAGIAVEKDRRKNQGYGSNGRLSADMPDTRPGGLPRAQSVPIGEKPPPVPKPDSGPPLQFRVLARWETAAPVRLAGGPAMPDLPGRFYVIRLRGLPLMPPPKVRPGEAAPNPNEGMLQAIKEGSRLERKDQPAIPCDHLFTGSGETAMEVLLFFPRGSDPITVRDKLVTLESRFAAFHLSIRFPLKDMMYKGDLAI